MAADRRWKVLDDIGRPVIKILHFTAESPGAILTEGTKIPQVVWCG